MYKKFFVFFLNEVFNSIGYKFLDLFVVNFDREIVDFDRDLVDFDRDLVDFNEYLKVFLLKDFKFF